MPLTQAFGRSVPRTDRILLLVGVLAACAFGFALLAQHAWDLQPCPWCIVQRLIVLVIGVLAFGAAWLFRPPASGRGLYGALSGAPQGPGRLRRALGGLLMVSVLGLALAGVVAALYQHLVAAQSLGCAFTWADRFLLDLGLGPLWPDLFEVRATCAEAAEARILGLPFEALSGAFFAFVTLLIAINLRTVLRSFS